MGKYLYLFPFPDLPSAQCEGGLGILERWPVKEGQASQSSALLGLISMS